MRLPGKSQEARTIFLTERKKPPGPRAVIDTCYEDRGLDLTVRTALTVRGLLFQTVATRDRTASNSGGSSSPSPLISSLEQSGMRSGTPDDVQHRKNND